MSAPDLSLREVALTGVELRGLSGAVGLSLLAAYQTKKDSSVKKNRKQEIAPADLNNIKNPGILTRYRCKACYGNPCNQPIRGIQKSRDPR